MEDRSEPVAAATKPRGTRSLQYAGEEGLRHESGNPLSQPLWRVEAGLLATPLRLRCKRLHRGPVHPISFDEGLIMACDDRATLGVIPTGWAIASVGDPPAAQSRFEMVCGR